MSGTLLNEWLGLRKFIIRPGAVSEAPQHQIRCSPD